MSKAIEVISTENFRATEKGLRVQGHPEYELWEAYGEGISRIGRAWKWVLADWLNYGEAAYGEMYAQAMEQTGLEEQTLKNTKWVGSRVELSRRRDLSFEHHAEVAKFEPEAQTKWLDIGENRKTEDNPTGGDPLPLREFRQRIREGTMLPPPPIVPMAGKYNVIALDPPWPYGTQYDQEGRRASSPYPEMSLDALGLMQLPAADDCILWLWTTHAFMRHAFGLLDMWEFRDVAILTWVKDRMGLGQWLRSQSEFCIMAVKGKPRIGLTNQTTVLNAPMRQHSRKPDEFYAFVESLVPAEYSKLDFFSREKRAGWDQYGNEPDKF